MHSTLIDKATFLQRGIVRLKSCIPRTRTLSAKERILNELERLRIRENGKWHNKQFDNLQPFQVTTHIGQRLKHHAAFEEVISQELVSYVQELAEGTQLKPQPVPQILVTPPQKGSWSIPHLGWHVDVRASAVAVCTRGGRAGHRNDGEGWRRLCDGYADPARSFSKREQKRAHDANAPLPQTSQLDVELPPLSCYLKSRIATGSIL